MKLAIQLRKYIFEFRGGRVNEMSNLTNKYVPGITLFTQIIVSFLVDKKHQCTCLSLTVLEHRELGENCKKSLSAVSKFTVT